MGDFAVTQLILRLAASLGVFFLPALFRGVQAVDTAVADAVPDVPPETQQDSSSPSRRAPVRLVSVLPDATPARSSLSASGFAVAEDWSGDDAGCDSKSRPRIGTAFATLAELARSIVPSADGPRIQPVASAHLSDSAARLRAFPPLGPPLL